jgi:arsenite methyltransferase
MRMSNEVRERVRQHYGDLARRSEQAGGGSCCGCGPSCCDLPIANAGLLYEAENLSGLPEEAVSLSLGCANPLVLAGLKEGETVLDLGSGGGLDVLAASRYVGPGGRVYGLDMTDDMLAVANRNRERMGVANVEFLKGYIEEIPLPDESVDVIISNCVINLSEDKERALSEAYRVLKPGGRLAVADMVALKDVSPEIRKITDLWCGCLAGTLPSAEYRRILEQVGFKEVDIEPAHVISGTQIDQLIQEHRQSGAVAGIDLDALDGAFAGANIRALK